MTTLRLLAMTARDALALWLLHAALVCASPLFGRDLVRAVLPVLARQVDRVRALRGAPPSYSR